MKRVFKGEKADDVGTRRRYKSGKVERIQHSLAQSGHREDATCSSFRDIKLNGGKARVFHLILMYPGMWSARVGSLRGTQTR